MRIGISQDWQLGRLEPVRIGKYEDWNQSGWANMRIGTSQDWQLGELEAVWIGN